MKKNSILKRISTFIFALIIILPFTFSSVNAESYSNGYSSNRDYEWYMDQGFTGTYSGSNCGPTSTAMILKWKNRNSKETGLSLRNWNLNNGNWWSTNIIQNCLSRNGIGFSAYRYSEYTLQNTIKNGGIALVCLDMSVISRNNSEISNTGRFYDGVTGHFIIVKGYRYIDGVLYFEVYDPFSMGKTYSNGQPMGKDRLYKASELGRAINYWWKTIYTIR